MSRKGAPKVQVAKRERDRDHGRQHGQGPLGLRGQPGAAGFVGHVEADPDFFHEITRHWGVGSLHLDTYLHPAGEEAAH